MAKFAVVAGAACVVATSLVMRAAEPANLPASGQTSWPAHASDNEPGNGISATRPIATAPTNRVTVKIDRFEFEGNSHFPAPRLREVVDESLKKSNTGWPVNRQISLDDLEQARLALTHFYVDAGYITSGALLPSQPTDTGVIRFQIFEGKVADVRVTWREAGGKTINRHLLRSSYIIERVQYSAGPPLNILRLKDELEILRQDPNIKSINAELKPGVAPGESMLDVQVQESNPFQIGLQFSNRRPPSVGSTALDVLVSDSNLSGNGDLLSVRYDALSGPIQDLRLTGAKDFSLDYSIPFTPSDTTFSVEFSRTDTVVVSDTFAPLHIGSQSDSVSFTLRQPIYRKPTADPAANGKPASPSIEFDLFATGSLRDNHTTLLGQPFSFSRGDENGAEHVTAIRLGQELTARTERDAFSGRSTFSLGVPWFDATRQRSGIPSGDFFAWAGQAQYVHLLGNTNIQLVLRGTAQLADRPLLTLEQFSLGGVSTVRGYPENFLVTDNAVAGTFELRIPVLRKDGADMLTLVPFFDAGYGWNHHPTTVHGETIDSAGLGILFNPDRHFSAQLYYGQALQNHAKDSHDVQNLGLHFNVLVLLF